MKKLSFLIVDDASFIRDLVKRSLKSQLNQCLIDEAINGKKAQSLLTKNRYDLVLCDWEMPEMSGLEVLQWLRAREAETNQRKTPFMMVTSRGDKSNVVKAVEAGVSGYIGKPFSSEQLLKKALKLLSVEHKELVAALLNGSSPMPSPNLGNDSATLLTQQPSAAATNQNVKGKDASSANLLTAGSVSSKLVQEAPTKLRSKRETARLGKITLRSANTHWSGLLKDINLTDASVSIEFLDSAPPAVLEHIVIDISAKEQPGQVARINTFVTSITLIEKSQDCAKAIVGIHIADNDQEKMEVLSHFVAEVR